jgi:hypothetical protein
VGRRSAAIRAPHCMRCAGVMAARAHNHTCAHGRTRTHIRARDPRAHTRARTCTNASTRAHSRTHPSTHPPNHQFSRPSAQPHTTRACECTHRTAPHRTHRKTSCSRTRSRRTRVRSASHRKSRGRAERLRQLRAGPLRRQPVPHVGVLDCNAAALCCNMVYCGAAARTALRHHRLLPLCHPQ